MAIAQSILENSAVLEICNFAELSETCGFMFFCAVITCHLLKRVAFGRIGTFNPGCRSARTYTENVAVLNATLTKQRMEEKGLRLYEALEALVVGVQVFDGQKFDSDPDDE
ncbi:hypothetical protein BDR26DRAFT_915244 [Obelidium mucronatum]|nr:hypothetical protein BDR26DRAFT_915244 [Obelidium mucronatum]